MRLILSCCVVLAGLLGEAQAQTDKLVIGVMGDQSGVVADVGHELGELGVAPGALPAIGQVLEQQRVEQLAAALPHVAVEQPLIGQVLGVPHNGLPPSNPRSLRAARNR